MRLVWNFLGHKLAEGTDGCKGKARREWLDRNVSGSLQAPTIGSSDEAPHIVAVDCPLRLIEKVFDDLTYVRLTRLGEKEQGRVHKPLWGETLCRTAARISGV